MCRRYRGMLSCVVRASGGEAQSRWSDTGVVLSLVSEGGLKLRIFYFDAAQWAVLDSRGCLPPVAVAAQAGGGGETSCSAECEQAPPCPVCDAGRWSCHRRFVRATPPPQWSPARDTFPSAGLSSSRVCAAKAVRTQGQCRRDAARETTPAKARLASVAWGSPSKSRAWLYPQLSR